MSVLPITGTLLHAEFKKETSTLGIEIERKFLVTGTSWRANSSTEYRQGYLNREPARTVRVRIAGEAAWLTIKGLNDGPTRPEFEYPIPLADAKQLLELCEQPIIEKKRFLVEFEGKTWEIDEFLGDNAGLVVAEIELSSADEEFARPDWLGEEVTSDARYFNSSLSKQPFCNW